MYIAVDNDPHKAGEKAGERLAERAIEAGVESRLIYPKFGDFNDDLKADGIAAVSSRIADQISARIA